MVFYSHNTRNTLIYSLTCHDGILDRWIYGSSARSASFFFTQTRRESCAEWLAGLGWGMVEVELGVHDINLVEVLVV